MHRKISFYNWLSVNLKWLLNRVLILRLLMRRYNKFDPKCMVLCLWKLCIMSFDECSRILLCCLRIRSAQQVDVFTFIFRNNFPDVLNIKISMHFGKVWSWCVCVEWEDDGDRIPVFFTLIPNLVDCIKGNYLVLVNGFIEIA